MLKRTALYDEHVRLGGRMVDFGGWELPVQYTGVMDEHLGCRKTVGLFDVSHMGEVFVEGADSEAFLNYLVTNDVSKIADHQAQYAAMCNDTGGLVDDLVIYRRTRDKFLVVVNASNTDKDFAWMKSVLEKNQSRFKSCTLENKSPEFTQIAVQGRFAEKLLQKLTKTPLSPIKTYWFDEGKILENIPCIFGRTGYTGEDGFEIYIPWNEGPKVWRAILEAGAEFEIKPCGLGARDTLRLEMAYSLYGHELSDETNPLEVGLGWITKLGKGDFVGKNVLLEKKAAGLKKTIAGIKLIDRGIPRQGYKVFSSDGQKEIGILTSGTQSPSTGITMGLASIDKTLSAIGTNVLVEIRGTKLKAEVVATPFYKRNY